MKFAQNPTWSKRRYGLLKGLALTFFLLASVMPPTVLANESEKTTFDSTTKLQTILTSSHRSVDYPGGVWTLPPTLNQGQKDRQRFLAIGESDRMTLKFVKPKTSP